MIKRVSRAILVVVLLASCSSERPAGICVESVCFPLPLDTIATHAGRRHTLRLPGSVGWISVQRFTPELPLPNTLADVVPLLSARFSLDRRYRVLSASITTINGNPATVHDVLITPSSFTPSAEPVHADSSVGPTLRRRHFLLRASDGGDWLSIGITAPTDSFDRACSSLLPAIDRLQLRTSSPTDRP
jgi:hypothetical protein